MTTEDKLFFNENGYLILNWKFSDEIISKVLQNLAGKYRYNSPHYNLNNRIEAAYEFSSYVRDIAADERVYESLKELLGGDFFPFQTLNFEKGTEQKFHSDWFHFAPTDNSGLAGVWVAFEDTDIENGALKVVPGSHKLPYYYPSDLGIDKGSKIDPYKNYQLYERAIEGVVADSGLSTKVIPLKKGEVLVWHSNLIHGGTEIVDKTRTRYSQVTHYFRKGNLYFSPIKSSKNVFLRSYRVPLNILTGKRYFF